MITICLVLILGIALTWVIRKDAPEGEILIVSLIIIDLALGLILGWW